MTTEPTVGLIGVGLMGTALAERFLASGFRVLAWDSDHARREHLHRLGGIPASSPRAVFTSCHRVVMSLPDLNVSQTVIHDHRMSMECGTIILDTTTGDPGQAEHIGAELAAQGVAYLDATIAGSSEQVRQGEVTVTVGGSAEAFETCQDLFAAFARAFRHVGPCGSGSRMKLVINLVLGLNRAALAEGLVLAREFGLDLDRTLDVLREGLAYSRIMDTKGPKMIHGDYTPQARLSQHLKDVRLMLTAAERLGMALPLTSTHRKLLESAEEIGCGPLDNSAIIQVYEQLRGAIHDR